MAADSPGLFLFTDQVAEEGCKLSVTKTLGVDSALSRQWSWMFSSYQVMLQNQKSILEEVAAKIFCTFPTVLPLFIVSPKCCSNTDVVQTTLCVSR